MGYDLNMWALRPFEFGQFHALELIGYLRTVYDDMGLSPLYATKDVELKKFTEIFHESPLLDMSACPTEEKEDDGRLLICSEFRSEAC